MSTKPIVCKPNTGLDECTKIKKLKKIKITLQETCNVINSFAYNQKLQLVIIVSKAQG